MQPMTGYGVYGTTAQPRAAHPIWRYALIFGALNGVFALLQVAFSSYAAVVNNPAFASLSYGVQNGGFQPNTIIRWLAPVAIAGYGSCLLGFVASLWLCWHAGRAAAAAAGRRTVGAGAGLLTSAIGSVVWIVASIIVVVILHTDATITGILATTPERTSVNLGGELLGLIGQEILAALVALGFGALAGRSGANHAQLAADAGVLPPTRSAPPAQLPTALWPPHYYGGAPGPYAPPFAYPPAGAYPPPPPPGYPPASWGYPPSPLPPGPTMPAYPPPPEHYRTPAPPQMPPAPPAPAGPPAGTAPGTIPFSATPPDQAPPVTPAPDDIPHMDPGNPAP